MQDLTFGADKQPLLLEDGKLNPNVCMQIISSLCWTVEDLVHYIPAECITVNLDENNVTSMTMKFCMPKRNRKIYCVFLLHYVFDFLPKKCK